MYVGKKRIIAFLILACGITWAFWILQSLFGITEAPLVYFFIVPAILGPAFAALIVLYKKMLLRDYIKHCFTFKQKLSYYIIFAAFIVWRFFLMMAVGSRIEGSTLYLPLLLMPICLFTGGNEEFGWRGFLQPQMEKKMHAVPAALIFAAYWTLWHLPLFFLPIDPRSPFEILFLLGFFLTNAFTIAALYKITKSALLCVFFHAWANALTNAFSLEPDLKVILGFSLELLIAVIILVMCERGKINRLN
jgi:membrane protease YdiL (CAAX protease family)